MWKYSLLSCAGFFRSRQGQLWQLVLSHAERREYVSRDQVTGKRLPMARKGFNLAALRVTGPYTDVRSLCKIRFERAAFFAHVFNGVRQR